MDHSHRTYVLFVFSSLVTPDNCNSWLLRTVLRDEWNFTGVAFSDNSAVAMIYSSQHYAPVRPSHDLSQPADGGPRGVFKPQTSPGHLCCFLLTLPSFVFPSKTFALALQDPLSAAYLALNAGLDQDMASGGPFNNSWNYGDTVYAAYIPIARLQGLVTEEQINTALTRILVKRFKMGVDDPRSLDPWAHLGPDTIGAPPFLKLALQAGKRAEMLLCRGTHFSP